MNNPRLEDHAVGVELQIVELVEQLERAVLQERHQDAVRIQTEVDALRDEMARTAEVIARNDAEPPAFNEVERADQA